MKYYSQEIDPIDYLNNLLSNWKKFCESHRVLAEAIKAVLDENKKLLHETERVTCKDCSLRYSESCPLFYAKSNGLRFFTSGSDDDDFWCKKGVHR